jgi:hypothetical protein
MDGTYATRPHKSHPFAGPTRPITPVRPTLPQPNRRPQTLVRNAECIH